MIVDDALHRRLLTVLSGQPSGVPEYVRALSTGDDAGWFPEGGAVWTVHQDIATLVAGPRALLMQALHPGAMAGVHDWSRYRQDPLGRLNGTIRWITTVSYGSRAQAEGASRWVQHLHEHVRGTYAGADGRTVPYAAEDADLLTWVHIAFADSFLSAFLRYGTRPLPGGPDAYVREWAVAGDLMGVPDPPRSLAGLHAAIDRYRSAGVLRADDRALDAVRFIRHAPLPLALRPTYRFVFAGAAASLPAWARTALRIRRPVAAEEAGTRLILRMSAGLLGTAAAPGQQRLRIAALEERAATAAQD